MKIPTFYLIGALLLCGCAAESVTTGTKQLTRAFVERNLVKGKTTKAQVVALLGEPQSTTSGSYVNAAGAPAEIWTYTKTFYRDPAEKGFGYGVAYNMFTGQMYDRIETSVLIVSFNGNGRVIGHTFSAAHVGSNQ